MQKNVATKIALFAFTPADGLPKTGDAANITAYVSKDYGTVTVLGDTSATEMDATNAPGWYLFDVAQAETNADALLFTAKSSTSGVKVVGRPVFTVPIRFTTLVIDAAGLADANMVKAGPTGSGTAQTAKDIGGAVPAAAAGASGGLLISGSNSGTTTLGALTVTGATTLTGAVAATNASNDVRGILLQATQTGVTIPTVTTVTNQLTAAQIATGVWQDATSGDFTVASSIGKSLYTGVAPGASTGLFISGSNTGTTTIGSIVAGATAIGSLAVSGTTTFTGALSATNNGNNFLINGATPGSSGGLLIIGNNNGAPVAFTSGLTTNITGNLSGSVGSVTGNVGGDVAGNVAGSIIGMSASNIASTLLGTAVDGTTTVAQSVRLANSALGGKASGLATTTATYRDLADTKDRIVATVDSSGNRSAVTLTLT